MTDTRTDCVELMLPALVADSRVSVRYDVESLGRLEDCWECTKHPPPDYLTGGAPLPRAAWRIHYIRGDQDGCLDVCGRWCSDWALGGLLSDPIYPATKIVLHVHAELRVAPPRPRRAAVRGPDDANRPPGKPNNLPMLLPGDRRAVDSESSTDPLLP